MGHWKLKSFLVSALVLVIVGLSYSKPGVVTTTDGATLEGDVIERNNDVVVRRHGVDTVMPREQIVSIDYSTFEERFRMRMGALDPSDSEGRIALAREAYDRREYALAIEAIDEAVLIDPTNTSARDLADVIRRQAHIEANRSTTKSADPTPKKRNPREGLMNDDQINRIRLYEMRAGDRQMRISFRGNVRQRYIAKHPPMTFRQFNSQSYLDQALTIRDYGTADMIDDLRVMNDPPAMESFINRIEPVIVRGCATSRCHGGPNGGDFRLIVPSTNREIKYTNFHLIMSYVREADANPDSVFRASTLELVRRGESAKSLLTQYALPRNKSSTPHPDVKNFSPLVYSPDHPIYQEMVRWMDNLLQPLAPEYGFEFSYQFNVPDDSDSVDEPSSTEDEMTEESIEPSTQPASDPTN